jgi:hypothetical protein
LHRQDQTNVGPFLLIHDAKWIEESFDDVETQVYVTPIGDANGPFAMTPAYKNAARQLGGERIALARARLANVIKC